MLFECSRYDLRNEIILGIHDLFQAGPYPAAGVDRRLPVGVFEHLHDRVDEGLLSIMRGPVSVPLSHAAHKKVQGIQIWRAKGPFIPLRTTEFSQNFFKNSKFQLFPFFRAPKASLRWV